MVRLDTGHKTLMDAIKITARNLFYRALAPFKAAYNHYRDDHDYFRELSQSVDASPARNRSECECVTSTKTNGTHAGPPIPLRRCNLARHRNTTCFYPDRARSPPAQAPFPASRGRPSFHQIPRIRTCSSFRPF